MAGHSQTRSAADAESQRLWRLAGMGGTMASEIIAGALIGWGLDAWLGTSPRWIIVTTIAGVVVGMATFIRGAIKESKQSSRDAGRIAETLHEREAAEAAARAAADDDRPGSAWRDE